MSEKCKDILYKRCEINPLVYVVPSCVHSLYLLQRLPKKIRKLEICIIVTNDGQANGNVH